MSEERIIARVLGTVLEVGSAEGTSPFLPLIVQFNAETGVLNVGDTVDVVVRVEVQGKAPPLA